MMLDCQVKVGGQWQAIDIADALASFKDDALRCIECYGPVCAHKKYVNGVAAHFEHVTGHTGCSQISRNFSGVKSKHPDALK